MKQILALGRLALALAATWISILPAHGAGDGPQVSADTAGSSLNCNGPPVTFGAKTNNDVAPSCALGPPYIDVDPPSLASTQLPDLQTTKVFSISNSGPDVLYWTVTEEAPLPTWTDDFDSYSFGSNLHGQGGWIGWGNNPAVTAVVTNTLALSPPNSVAIAAASDMVRPFVGITSGQWIYTAWQYVPSSFSGSSYFILLNTYNLGGPYNWSTQVVMDGGTGLVTNTGASGGSAPLVQNQWVEIRLEIDLDSDTQAFYYNNLLLYSGTWTAEVSGGGVTTIASVSLFANGSTPIYYDDLSLVNPSFGACAGSGGVPWASAAPTMGRTPSGGHSLVDVTFDSTGLGGGVYTGDLCIQSTDPTQSEVVLPLTLTVAPNWLYLPIVLK